MADPGTPFLVDDVLIRKPSPPMTQPDPRDAAEQRRCGVIPG
jgi:hypothetical protein